MTERHTRWSRRDWNSKPKNHMCSALKEKTYAWIKSCKESAKRETELYKMIEIATKDENQEDTERNTIKKRPKPPRKEEEEADEARTLLDDMQQNVNEANAKKNTETRRRLYREINEYMHSWTKNLDGHTISWIKCGK